MYWLVVVYLEFQAESLGFRSLPAPLEHSIESRLTKCVASRIFWSPTIFGNSQNGKKLSRRDGGTEKRIIDVSCCARHRFNHKKSLQLWFFPYFISAFNAFLLALTLFIPYYFSALLFLQWWGNTLRWGLEKHPTFSSRVDPPPPPPPFFSSSQSNTFLRRDRRYNRKRERKEKQSPGFIYIYNQIIFTPIQDYLYFTPIII